MRWLSSWQSKRITEEIVREKPWFFSYAQKTKTIYTTTIYQKVVLKVGEMAQ